MRVVLFFCRIKMRMKMCIGRFLAAAALSLFLGSPHAAGAAEAAPSFWNKVCDKGADGKGACAIEQFALAMPQKTVMAHIRFARTEKPDQMRMTLVAPLGVLLAPGLTLSVDGSPPIGLPFERCSAQGCGVSAVLDKSALTKFFQGKTLVVRYTVSGQAGVDVPIKLDGLAGALQSLPN